jgi:hypothetical protein
MMLGTFRRLQNFCLRKQISHVFLVIVDWVRSLFYFGSIRPRELTGPTVLTEQVAGGIVVPGSGRLVAALGVDDLVIVDMPDTLLVTTRARSQEVKRLVKRAKEAGWRRLL